MSKNTKQVAKPPGKPQNEARAVAKKPTDSKAVVPRAFRDVAPIKMKRQEDGLLVPEGYTARIIKPAKNADVISLARAMNPDMGPRVQKLFEVEKQAAIEAQQSGIYIGWRCPEFTWDCQRVSQSSKCFCGHLLSEHEKFTGRKAMLQCREGGCRCKGYAWIPSRPEEVGEFWFARRRDFDPSTWRAKCRCKHTHEEHDPTALRGCRAGGCGCRKFDSNFLCAACDKHWEEHETFFDTEDERRAKKMPTGADYLPFAEIPTLRNMVLTGVDDGDESFLQMEDMRQQLGLPPSNPPADNNSVVRYNGGQQQGGRRGGPGGPSGSGFKAVYD